MDIRTWRPHGLISKPGLEMPYRHAKRSIDAQGNETDPKEHFTVHLFEDLFNKVIFSEDNFFVNSQQPPASKKGTERACDISIKHIADDFEHQILCFAEAKRARNVIYSKIQELEDQALSYCLEFLTANPDVGIIYACTLVGASIRCWSLRAGEEKFQGFWGDENMGSFDFYKDVGDDAHFPLLERSFNMMKVVPTGIVPRGLSLANIGSTSGQPEPGS